MNQINQHLKELLTDCGWKYSLPSQEFRYGPFNVNYDGHELKVRCNSGLIASIPVRPTESLEQVHHALKSLFACLPRYDVRLVREQP